MQDNIEYHPTSASIKAVTIVAHGLNMKPIAMLPLTQWLNGQGSDVYLLKLSGHFEESTPIKHITTTVWEEEMHHAYTIAKGAANNNNVPLFFIGYSLGALLGQALMCTSAEPCGFDKQVLMAPATAIRSRGYIIKHLFFLRKKLMLPSFSPQLYRANNFLPLTAYEVLFRNEQQILAAQFSKLNIPTLVFIDPEDELISYKKLVNFVQTFKLTNYEIITLDSNLQSRYGRFHHLVVSEHTMGKQNWKMVTGRMATFLFGATKEQ